MAEPMKLGLKALAAGVEHIPNEYWEKLPPFKRKEGNEILDAEKTEERHSRKSKDSKDSHRSRRPKARRNSTGTNLAAGGAGAAVGAGAGYEANRRKHRSSQDGDDSNDDNNYRNGSSAMPDDRYSQNTYQPPRDGYDSQYDNHSYQPNQYVPPGYGAGDVARRQSSAGPNSRNDRSSRYDQDDYSDNDDERERHRSGRRDSRRARSPDVGGVRGKVSKNLDLSEKGLGYGVLGAIAGGFIGHEFGKGPIATGVGAVVGGLGANVLEAREERHKLNSRREAKYAGRRSRSENRRHSSSYDDSSQSYYNDSNYNNGRGYVESDEEYDDRSNRRSRRDSSRR